MRPTTLLSLRRTLQHVPRQLPSRHLPASLVRRVTIQAGTPIDEPDGSTSPNYELVSGSSQHPFASAGSGHEGASSLDSSSESAESSSTSHPHHVETQGVVATLPQPPPPTPPVPLPHLQHPFDTHAFVTYLEKSEVTKGNAVILMEAVRDLIIKRKLRALERMLGKEDMENAAYLFRAALSELRAELSVRAKSDSMSMKQSTLAIRREIDSLEQKMKEDVQTLKHDIEMDMNNRKSETRSEQKLFDLHIEEINNKFTISLGDLRTEIESAKWESVRRAMSILVLFVVTTVGTSAIFGPDSTPAPVPAAVVPVMRDMAVGTDDDDEVEEIDTEQKLEKILSHTEIPHHKPKKVKPKKKEKEELHVDRI